VGTSDRLLPVVAVLFSGAFVLFFFFFLVFFVCVRFRFVFSTPPRPHPGRYREKNKVLSLFVEIFISWFFSGIPRPCALLFLVFFYSFPCFFFSVLFASDHGGGWVVPKVRVTGSSHWLSGSVLKVLALLVCSCVSYFQFLFFCFGDCVALFLFSSFSRVYAAGGGVKYYFLFFCGCLCRCVACCCVFCLFCFCLFCCS